MNSVDKDEADPLVDFFLVEGLEVLDVILVDFNTVEGVLEKLWRT